MTREWLRPKAITNCQQDKVARCHTSGEVLKALAHSNEEVLLTAAHSTCLKTSCIIKTAIPGHKLRRPWQGNPSSWLCPRRMLKTHLQQVCKVSRLSSHQIWESCELQINQNRSGPGCLWMKVQLPTVSNRSTWSAALIFTHLRIQPSLPTRGNSTRK